MEKKIGRNDPCPCGSGKKYKSCCLLKEKPKATQRKLTAKWINRPEGPNLIERAYGSVIAPVGEAFKPLKTNDQSEAKAQEPESEDVTNK